MSTEDKIMGDSDDDIEQVRKAEDVREKNDDKERRKRYVDLYVAAAKGDWGKAKAILKDYPEDVVARLGLSEEGDTTLHVATAAGQNYFVIQLLMDFLKPEDLELRNDSGNTAFCLAATSGNIKLVQYMWEKNEKLPMIHNGSGMLPVQMAALLGHEMMAEFLYEATRDKLSEDDLIELLLILIDNNLYDLALLMVKEVPKLAIVRAKRTGETDLDDESGETDLDDENEIKKVEFIGETALNALARKPLMTFNDLDSSILGILKRFYYRRSTNKKMHPKALELVKLLLDQLESDQISDLVKNPFSLISVAAEKGNIDFLSILFSKHPALISKVNEDGYTIFHTAVLYRHKNIFKLIYEKPSMKNVIFALSVRKERNNILHLAAILPPERNRLDLGAGAAFQMQRELLWFQEVSKLMPPSYAEAKNRNGYTARDLFSEQHRSLRKEGEEWMKRTAESCMLVSTLIATVVFAAAITVPGGVKEDTGAPNFLKKATFLIFAISDTISLVSSSCSILTFLSIFTARYAEEEFLWSLPNKLFWGVLTLFVSIIAMMVVFCATMFIIFYDGTIGPFVLAVALASIPVFMFIYQQNHILSQVFQFMPSSHSLFQDTHTSLI